MAEFVDRVPGVVGSAGRPLLRLDREVTGHAVVVHAVGEVDVSTTPLLDEQLRVAESVVVAPAPVVAELSGVRLLSCQGLTVLVEHHQRCAGRKVPLRLVADHRAVLRPLRLTGLDTTLTVRPDLPTALRPDPGPTYSSPALADQHALRQGREVCRGQGFSLHVTATAETHRALLAAAAALNTESASSADRKAYRIYGERLNTAAISSRND
ncbi:anti-sigma factor antagonist [Amycolatopsis anabasis]|uniref:anti-sigma factor antagonist n=1 Tax=Amycolatopsis anabasis TaxID=1840409 RepID=UPI00131C494A|nr:anti-sigma factor antagonist [Amycolatopsis anabasis]